MSKPKADLRLPPRTPAYVTREVGAAELSISAETWDRWVKDGILPPPAPGAPGGKPLWRWRDVDARMAGRPLDGAEEADHGGDRAGAAPEIDLGAERAAFLRDGPSPRSRSAAPRARALRQGAGA